MVQGGSLTLTIKERFRAPLLILSTPCHTLVDSVFVVNSWKLVATLTLVVHQTAIVCVVITNLYVVKTEAQIFTACLCAETVDTKIFKNSLSNHNQ